jgi:hypothetical protein
MSRYLRNRSVLAALESTNGTLATMVAADAILLKDVQVTLPSDGDPRNLIRGFMGGSEELDGSRRMELTFTVECASSGTLGTAPWWGKLLRACGFAEVVTASTRVDYTPLSTAFESLSFSFANDGVKYTGRFGRGSAKFNFTPYKAPTIEFKFWAIDATGTAAANPAPTYSTMIRPQVVSDGNLTSLKQGGSYAAGVVTGGTALAWDAFSVDLNNSLEHVLLVGGAEAIDISDRSIKGATSVFLDAANEVTWRSDRLANTLNSFSLQHGATGTNKIILHGPSVQKTNVQPAAGASRLMTTADLMFLPTGTGNNDLTLCVL